MWRFPRLNAAKKRFRRTFTREWRAADRGQNPEGWRLLQLAVWGMYCEDCAAKIIREIVRHKGVVAVTVDRRNGRAPVLYDRREISGNRILALPIFGVFSHLIAQLLDDRGLERGETASV